MVNCTTTRTSYVSRASTQMQSNSIENVDFSKQINYHTSIYGRQNIDNINGFIEIALQNAATQNHCDFVAHPTIFVRKFIGAHITIEGYAGYYQSDTTYYSPIK